jgi:hypothetical protein
MLCVSACKSKQAAPVNPAIWEAGREDTHSVFFDIRQGADPKGATLLIAHYNAEGKVAKFRVEIDHGKQSGSGKPGDFNFVDGEGAFIAEPGSDASIMLAELKKALEATKSPARIKRVERLPFTYVILGQNQSRGPDGGFNGDPTGKWTAMKIFMETSDPDEDDCEVFLNFNVDEGKAEFSEKDVDFGNEVLAKLSKVL